MFSSPTLSHFSFSIILLQAASYSQDSTSMMGMSMWFILLVPFFIMMVVLGSQNTSDDEEELEVGNTYMERRKKWKGMMIMKLTVMMDRNPKRAQHPCGSM
jgi:hypothetical protein